MELHTFWKWFSHLPPEQFIGVVLIVGGVLICGFMAVLAWAEKK